MVLPFCYTLSDGFSKHGFAIQYLINPTLFLPARNLPASKNAICLLAQEQYD